MGRENLSFVPASTSFVDVTLRGDGIVFDSWRFLEDYSLSDHPYIFMSIRRRRQASIQSSRRRSAPRVSDVDKEMFRQHIGLQFQSAEFREVPESREAVERLAGSFTDAIIAAARSSKVRRVRAPECLAPWWNPELEEL